MRQYYLGALQWLLLCLGSCARNGRDVGQGLRLPNVGSFEVGEITVGNSGISIEDHRDAVVHRKIRQDGGISVDELPDEASQISASNEPTGEMDNLPFEPIDIASYWQSIYGTEDVPEFENPPEIEGKSLKLDDIIESEDWAVESVFNKRSLNEASDINSLHNSKQGEERESLENNAKEVDDDGNEPRRFVSTQRNVGTSSEDDFNSSRTSQGSEAEDVEDSIVIPSGDGDLKIWNREMREPDERSFENIDDIQPVATSNDGVSNRTKEDIVKSTNLKKYQFSFVENGVPPELYLDAEASSAHGITSRTCHGSVYCPKCGGVRSQATGVQAINPCSCTEKIGNIGYNTDYLYPTYDSGMYSLVNPGVGNIIATINGQPYVYEEQLGNRAVTDAPDNGAVAGGLVIEKTPIIDLVNNAPYSLDELTVLPLDRVGQPHIRINAGRVHALKDADSVSIARNAGFYGSGHVVGDSLPCSIDGLTASPSGRIGQTHIDINNGRVHVLNDADLLSIAQNTGLYGSDNVIGDSSASILLQDAHSIGPNGELIIRRKGDSLGNVVHSHKDVVGYGGSSGIGKGTSKSDIFADVKKQALDTKKQAVQSTIIKLGDIGQMILDDGKKLVRNIAGKLEEILNAKEARKHSRGKTVHDILIDQKHGFIRDENTFESETHSSSHVHSDHAEHVDASALSDSAIIVNTESSHTDADIINSFSHNEAGIISANHGTDIIGNAIIKADSAVATHNIASAIDTSSHAVSANEEHVHSAVQSASHIAVNEELASSHREASSSARHEDAVIINTNQDVVGHSGSHLRSGFINAGDHASALAIDTSSQLISANEEHAHSAVQSASHIAVNEELASSHHEASSSARHEDAVIINTNQDVVGHSGSHLSSGFISAGDHASALAIDTSSQLISANEEHAHSAVQSASHIAVNEELASSHHEASSSARHEDAVIINTNQDVVGHSGSHLSSEFISAGEHASASAIDTSSQLISNNEEHAHSAVHGASHIAVNKELVSTHQEAISSSRHEEAAVINTNHGVIGHSSGHLNSGFINVGEHAIVSDTDTSRHLIGAGKEHINSAIHNVGHVLLNEALAGAHADIIDPIREIAAETVHCKRHISHADTDIYPVVIDAIKYNPVIGSATIHRASYGAVGGELTGIHNEATNYLKHREAISLNSNQRNDCEEEIINHTVGQVNSEFINAGGHTTATAVDTSSHIIGADEEHAHSALHSASHGAINEELASIHQDSFSSVRHGEAVTVNSGLGNDCKEEIITHTGGHINSGFISSGEYATEAVASAIDTSNHVINAKEEHAHSALHSASHVAVNEELGSTHQDSFSSVRHGEGAIINSDLVADCEGEIISHTGGHINSGIINVEEHAAVSAIDTSDHIVSVNEEHAHSALHSDSHVAVNEELGSTYQDSFSSIRHGEEISSHTGGHINSGFINAEEHTAASAIDTSGHIVSVNEEHAHSALHSASHVAINEELESTHQDSFGSVRHEEAATILNSNLGNDCKVETIGHAGGQVNSGFISVEGHTTATAVDTSSHIISADEEHARSALHSASHVALNEELESTYNKDITSIRHQEAAIINTSEEHSHHSEVIGHAGSHVNSEDISTGEYITASNIDSSSHIISSNEKHVDSALSSIGHNTLNEGHASTHKDTLHSVAHAAVNSLRSTLHNVAQAIVDAHSGVINVGNHNSATAIGTSTHTANAENEYIGSVVHSASRIGVNEELASTHNDALSSVRHEEAAIFNKNQEVIVNEELASTHEEAISSSRHGEAAVISTNHGVIGHSSGHLNSGFIGAGECNTVSAIDTSSHLISSNEERIHSGSHSIDQVASHNELSNGHKDALSSVAHAAAKLIHSHLHGIGHAIVNAHSGVAGVGEHDTVSVTDSSSHLISANEEHAHSAIHGASHIAVNEELASSHDEAISSTRHEEDAVFNTNQEIVDYSGFTSAGEHASASAIDTSSQLISAHEEHAHSAIESASHIVVNEELASSHHETSSSARHEEATVIDTNQGTIGHSDCHLNSEFISTGEHVTSLASDTSSHTISANEGHAHSAFHSTSHTAANEELESTHHEASSSARHEDAVIINTNQDVVGHSGSHMSSGFISAGEHASASAIDTSSQLISNNQEHVHSTVQSASHIAVNEESASTHHEASSSARHEDAVIINTNQDVVGHSGGHLSSGFISVGEHGSASAIDTSSHIINANEEHAHSAVHSASHISANEELASSHNEAISSTRHEEATLINTNQDVIGHSGSHLSSGFINTGEHATASAIDASSHFISANEEHAHATVHSASHIAANEESVSSHIGAISTVSHNDAAIISTNQEDDCKTGIIGHSVGHVNTEFVNLREHDDNSVVDTSSHTINAKEEHFDSTVQDISAEGHIISNTDSGLTRIAGHSTASAIDAFNFGHNEHVHSRIDSSELGNIEGPCKYSVNTGAIQGSVKNEFLESAVDRSTRIIENVINEAAKEFQMSADPSVKEKIVNLAASTVRKVITGVAEETARKFELAEQTAASAAAANHINLNTETVGVLLPADHHPHIYNTEVLDIDHNTDCAQDVAIELFDTAGDCDNSGFNPESFYNVDHYDLMYDNPETSHNIPVDFDIQFESGSNRHLANNLYFDNNIHHFQRSRGHTFVPVAKINNQLYRENLYNYNQFINAANNYSEKYELSPQTNFQLKFPHGGPVPFEFIKKHLSRGHDLAMEMRERVKWLESGSLHPKPHTASKLHFFNNKVSDSTVKINEESELALSATKLLQHGLSLEYNITPNTFLEFLRHHGLRITNKDVCAARYKRCKGDFEKYRSFDGSCNNIEHPTWGQSNLGFLRIIPPRYSDGIHAMPVSVTGEELPGPRLLSTTFFRRYNVTHADFTLALAQWGQVLSHDLAYQIMDQTAQGGIECCTSNGQSQLPKSLQHHSCMPIEISARDRFYRKYNQRCMNFVRSMTISKDDCTLGSADQLNGVTSYLDCSPIYGSDKSLCDQLRLFEGGRLKVELRRGRIMMPTTHDKSEFCDIVSPSEVCYLSGDVRANQNPHLVILLTLLVREHNRIAKELCTLNPHWGDERVFQEARRIVIAQYQHITYDEWLPLVIGKRYCKRFKLTRSRSGLSDDYNPEVNPTTINSFTSSAFRYFHSMVDGNINLCPASRQISHTLRLSNHYFRPQILERSNNFDELLRGLVTQRMQNADTNFHPELTEYLFRSRNDYGLDLAAIDIQRGRDNGIPGYNAYRKICRLKHAQDFGDLHEEISWDRIEELRHTYAHVDDIDLLVGAAMERRSSGSFLGPTMRCLIGEQFYRSRVGDRYFYDHGNVPRSFTEEQFQEIKKASLARLICDNEETVTMIQRNPFKVISYRNPLVSCRSLPKPNLAPWKE